MKNERRIVGRYLQDSLQIVGCKLEGNRLKFDPKQYPIRGIDPRGTLEHRPFCLPNVFAERPASFRQSASSRPVSQLYFAPIRVFPRRSAPAFLRCGAPKKSIRSTSHHQTSIVPVPFPLFPLSRRGRERGNPSAPLPGAPFRARGSFLSRCSERGRTGSAPFRLLAFDVDVIVPSCLHNNLTSLRSFGPNRCTIIP